MSVLDATLSAYALREGVAQRRTNYRHRRLLDEPVVVVGWQLGGEPFSIAALGYGTLQDHFDLAVPGQPLDRDLAFAAIEPVAEWFNARFEEPWTRRSAVSRGSRSPRTVTVAPSAPQVIVPNVGTVKLLRRLGRRLSFLPTVAEEGGPPPAPKAIVRFGRHLTWLVRHAAQPGQQVLLDAVTLCADNWTTAQTVAERANLAALDAWIEPPHTNDGFAAAAAAEATPVGPIPPPSWEADVAAPLIETFGEARRRQDESAADAALSQIVDVYAALTATAWDLVWRVVEREASWPEEPTYLPLRVARDADEYSRHMEWMDGPVEGRRRTRDTVRQAIFARRSAEEALQLLEAQEGCSDDLRMIPLLLDHKAVEGEIVSFDPNHAEVKPGNQRASRTPLVTLRTPRRSLVPVKKALWWTADPGKVCANVASVVDDPDGGGSLVTLKVMKGEKAARELANAHTACFSILTTSTFGPQPLVPTDPFTHIPGSVAAADADHIEPEAD